jgi:multimeric flavodoxin WrbA
VNIIGISASRREWGNTDILVRQALKGAAREGAQTRFLRLTDFKIDQCRECLVCLFKDKDCVIKDQLPTLLKVLREADAVVLGSPIHILFAAGAIGNLVPRLFRQGYTGEFRKKPGMAITVGGRPGWEGWALQQVMIFFLSLGMPIVDQFTGYAQGPGEIFFDTDACGRAFNGGQAMAAGETTYIGTPGTCPVCHCDLVFEHGDGRILCVMCDMPGKLQQKGKTFRFKPRSGATSRWDPKNNRAHFEKLILPSKKGFKSRKEEIRQKLEIFRKGENYE